MSTVLSATSGARMDRALPPRRASWVWRALAAAAVAGLAFLAWQRLPRGLPVALGDVDIAAARRGVFDDVLVTRASVQPLHTVLLDAAENGRVEQVLVKDGAQVEAGQLLFVLNSSQRAQELMQRSSEAAQQLANLATFRAAFVAAQAQQRRELTQGRFEEERARRAHERNLALAATGFVSPAALEESADRLAQAQRLLAQLRADGDAELATRGQSVRAMERAVAELERGLAALRAASDGLAVRAPVAGRLTGFALQLGESVQAGTRIARIDSSGRFKLTTRIDEFHLDRVHEGLRGTLERDGREFALSVSRIDPQVSDGRFSVELSFDGAGPADLQAGQGLDARLTLGRPGPALLLQDSGFTADTGGAWAFVLDADGRHAGRRELKLGRRAAGVVEVLGGLQPGERAVVSSYRPFLNATSLRLQD
ncbi:efflux RND transporter periplasmic adaptor subunit [Roseateles saccharophilus]|uniref:HlyD family secretion protein n=1 Tax=Roseateles saccharophilus TaxID=304 RepID=A0A4R3VA37_ROSSA|nr:HlyD family efflux transporter periplasmic adaptor subunit [Roseateles saccharophilus]MDG0831704.1 HlyD family efflux transporter periplasmic adaptor subunit [Roseateles saccharophilus]TCV00881.1 HlyD family secretion protein [Roseateles saccharophilus]